MSTHPTDATAELPELPHASARTTVPEQEGSEQQGSGQQGSEQQGSGRQGAEKMGAEKKGAGKKGGGRDRYFDLLRAIALFRVVFYHLMGWAWLPVLFPSMGVMFALAGNLMARSLAARPALGVVRGGCAGCCLRCGCWARSV